MGHRQCYLSVFYITYPPSWENRRCINLFHSAFCGHYKGFKRADKVKGGCSLRVFIILSIHQRCRHKTTPCSPLSDWLSHTANPETYFSSSGLINCCQRTSCISLRIAATSNLQPLRCTRKSAREIAAAFYYSQPPQGRFISEWARALTASGFGGRIKQANSLTHHAGGVCCAFLSWR